MVENVNDAFGTTFKEEQIGQVQIKGLPLSVTSQRSFYSVSDGTDAFLLVDTVLPDRFSISALSRQKELYEEKIKMPAAFYFSELTKLQRDSLISHRVPFICGRYQIYLPFLAVSLQNRFAARKKVMINKMMPVTQSLFLYLLYECDGKKVMKKEAAAYLKTTGTSITRASAQLAAMNLIRQEKQGKEFYMWTEAAGDELIQKALCYMINPVQAKITVPWSDFFRGLPCAGESAISGDSRRQSVSRKCVAVDKDKFRKYEMEIVSVNDECRMNSEEIDVELWKYDPTLFSESGLVDPISLYLSVREKADNNIKLQWRS